MKILSQLQIPGERSLDAPTGVPTAESGTTLSVIIAWSINLLLIAGIVATLFFLIWGGISWITSGGDREKLDKARKTITFAVIGLFVVLLSFVIVQTVGAVIGIDLNGLVTK